MLLGTPFISNTVWRYFFKAAQRPSLLPKDSAEFRGWYDTLPQTQPKDSEAYQAWEQTNPQLQPKDSEAYRAWEKARQKATPQMQPKKTKAFREWLQAVRENASKKSVDAHLWFKSKPTTADTNEDVRRLRYSQNPVTQKSLTGPDAKPQSGCEWGAWVGAGIGKLVGQFLSPLHRAQTAANSAQRYKCRQCGKSFIVGHLKRDIVIHIRHPANKKCLDMFSESGDVREMESIRLASQSELAASSSLKCPCCEEDLTRTSMLRHLETPDNANFKQYAGKSGDPKLKEIFDKLTTEALTLGCPCCRRQFPRSRFASEFKQHIKLLA